MHMYTIDKALYVKLIMNKLHKSAMIRFTLEEKLKLLQAHRLGRVLVDGEC